MYKVNYKILLGFALVLLSSSYGMPKLDADTKSETYLNNGVDRFKYLLWQPSAEVFEGKSFDGGIATSASPCAEDSNTEVISPNTMSFSETTYLHTLTEPIATPIDGFTFMVEQIGTKNGIYWSENSLGKRLTVISDGTTYRGGNIVFNRPLENFYLYIGNLAHTSSGAERARLTAYDPQGNPVRYTSYTSQSGYSANISNSGTNSATTSLSAPSNSTARVTFYFAGPVSRVEITSSYSVSDRSGVAEIKFLGGCAYAPCPGGDLTDPSCDYDGDGVINGNDLDDDNDGIPDIDESPEYFRGLIIDGGFTNANTAPHWYISQGDDFEVKHFQYPNGVFGYGVNSGQVNSPLYEDLFGELNGDNSNSGAINALCEDPNKSIVYKFPQKLSSTATYELAFDIALRGFPVSNNQDYVVYLYNGTTDAVEKEIVRKSLSSLKNYNDGGTGKGYQVINSSFSVNSSSDDYYLAFKTLGPSNSEDDFVIDRVAIREEGGACDYDKDGIPNHLDLDSDGDGCPDALEGDGGFSMADLQEAFNDGGNPAATKNLCADGACVDADGSPIVRGVTVQQGVGSSLDGIKAATCLKCYIVEGTVVTNDGSPLENNSVRIFSDFNGDGAVNGRDKEIATLLTGAAGNYTYPVPSTITIADNFEGSVFSNGDNSSGEIYAWLTTEWLQSNSSNSGTVNGSSQSEILGKQMYINNGTRVYRSVDLSGLSDDAFITFVYDRGNSFENGEGFIFRVSTDGGATYTNLYEYSNTTEYNNLSPQEVYIGIEDFTGPGNENVQVEFLSTSDNGEYVYIDDFKIHDSFPDIIVKAGETIEYPVVAPEKIAIAIQDDLCDEVNFTLKTMCEAYPLDTDSDGLCDALDIDDDNDGVTDKDEGYFCEELDRTIRVGYLDDGAAADGLMVDLLYNLNNFGLYGVYNKVRGVTLIPFSSPTEVTEANLLANNIDIFYVGSNIDGQSLNDPTYSGKAPTAVNQTLSSWAAAHNKGIFALQNNAVDYGYRLSNDNQNPGMPYGALGNTVFTNGYWPTTSLDQTGTVQLTIYSSTRSYDVLMRDDYNHDVLVADRDINLVIFPDATMYLDNDNTVTPSSDSEKAIASLWGYVFDRYLEQFCDEQDTDGDTVPNHLDTDSDNDGCSDAYEAGAIDDLLAPADFSFDTEVNTSSDQNGDGLADIVDSDLSGIVDYESTYNEQATNAAINSCQDLDGDGIPDLIDLDDDNDGILDKIEGHSCNAVLNRSFKVGYLDTSTGRSGMMTNLLINPDNYGENGVYSNVESVEVVPFASAGDITEASLIAQGIDVFFVGSSIADAENDPGSSGKVPESVNTTLLQWAIDHDKAVLVLQNNAIDYGYFITNDNDNPDVPYGLIGEQVFTNGYWPISDISQSGTVQMTVNSSLRDFEVAMVDDNGKAVAIKDRDRRIVIIPDATSLRDNQSSSNTDTNIRKFVANLFAYTFDVALEGVCYEIDTDGDGVPNHLDLDSDGDGCPDIKEAEVSDYLLENGQRALMVSGELVNVNETDDSQNTTITVGMSRLDPSNGGDNVGPFNGFHDYLEKTSSGVYENTPYQMDLYWDSEESACKIRRIYTNPAMHTPRRIQ
ncbi:hypothetical protein [Echinicola rosea]|uniref:Uncharacterized protein n=1 Tax=Echinicola rosea TaxID=1807691 RepID=A0ABQ1UM78_9BACT|nr:hypothetical protein [Echinicola rosea]GGF20245.1 hypothetical protein GCM10011339_05340 [Echinicola rosea]